MKATVVPNGEPYGLRVQTGTEASDEVYLEVQLELVELILATERRLKALNIAKNAIQQAKYDTSK